MTATWTRSDLSIRVEAEERGVEISTDSGQTWHVLAAHEARDLALGLCTAAERVEDIQTERDAT